MKPDTLLRRLASGGAIHYEYRRDEFAGLINAWKHGSKLILTWEECLDGDQWNESSYTLDERHEFDTPDEVLKFLVDRGIEVSNFQA